VTVRALAEAPATPWVPGGLAPPAPVPWAGPPPGVTPGAPAHVDSALRAPGREAVLDVVRAAVVTLSSLILGLALNLVIGTGLSERAAQARALDQFRQELALGTAPVGPRAHGRLLSLGTPVALLEIPSIGVRQVVGEGTTPEALMAGPGHLPSTVFPGGAGTSIVFGRAAAYGGPFARLAELRRGARVVVVTGVGTSTFRVVDLRRARGVIPPLGPGRGRLTLATATGSPYVPTGVQWVDADLVSPVLASAAPVTRTVAPDERPLGVSTSTLRALAVWLVVLAGVLAGGTWVWQRRGRAQAWIVFSAPVIVIGYLLTDTVAQLLPNLT